MLGFDLRDIMLQKPSLIDPGTGIVNLIATALGAPLVAYRTHAYSMGFPQDSAIWTKARNSSRNEPFVPNRQSENEIDEHCYKSTMWPFFLLPSWM